MPVTRTDDILLAVGGEVWERYGTLYKRTLPEEASPVTFTRSSVATFRDRSGNLRTAESGVIRPHWVAGESSYAIRLEASRTNELHNSTFPATQTRSLAAGTYTLWMEGTGSVDADGATDGAYGTATESTTVENDLTFTVSATQDVTFTVNGTVGRFQCEEGSFRSSFIATTSSAVTRAADQATVSIGFDPQELTAYVKFVEGGTIHGGSNAVRVWQLGGSGTAGNSDVLCYAQSGNYRAQHFDGSSSVTASDAGFAAPEIGDVVELRVHLASDGSVTLGQSINGGAEETTSSGANTLQSTWASDQIDLNARPGSPSSATGFNDFLALTISSGVKTMSEMRAVEI